MPEYVMKPYADWSLPEIRGWLKASAPSSFGCSDDGFTAVRHNLAMELLQRLQQLIQAAEDCNNEKPRER